MASIDTKTKIPEGWQQTYLNDDANFRVVGSRVNYWTGLKPYLSTKSVQGTLIAEIEDYVSFNNRPSRANMQPEVGVTAFAKMGDTFKVLFNNENIAKNYILSTGFCLVKPKIDPEYFFHFVASDRFQNNKELYCEGSTQKAISQKDYDKLEILFPKNSKEQKKIAEVLTTIDEAIEKTDAIIEKNKRIKQGLMQDLFHYGIDENGNIRSEKTHKFKTVNIGRDEIRIPEEWEVKTLLDAIGGNNEQIVAGPFGSNLKVSDYIDSGVPILRLQNINANKFIDKDIKYLSPFKANLLKYHSFVGGDIALAKLGDPVGETCIIPKQFTFGIVVADVVRIRVNKKYSDEKYITYILNSDYARLQLYLNVSGTTRPRVNLSHIRNMKFVFPKVEEQIRIALMLNLIDKNIDEDEIYKQKYLSLKSGLMGDLLTGTVRVNSLIND